MDINRILSEERDLGAAQLFDEILKLINEKIKENKKYFDEKDLCWLCYEDTHCYHINRIEALEDLKKLIVKDKKIR